MSRRKKTKPNVEGLAATVAHTDEHPFLLLPHQAAWLEEQSSIRFVPLPAPRFQVGLVGRHEATQDFLRRQGSPLTSRLRTTNGIEYVSGNHPGNFVGHSLDAVIALHGANNDTVTEALLRVRLPQPIDPAVRIDVGALEQMGQGDRVAALRLLGQVLRRFCPTAADELETYDGAIHGPPRHEDER